MAESEPSIKEQVAQVKAMSARRAQEAKQRDILIPPPIEGETLEDAYNAEKQLEERARENEAAEKARREKETGQYKFYIKCRRDHGKYAPHGVYLTVNPGHDYVKADQWFARYKAKNEVWREDVVCQVCLMQSGEYVSLNVEHGPKGSFKVPSRWLWRSPVDPKRRELEGDTRAMDIGPASSNNERHLAQERSREAGLEVL